MRVRAYIPLLMGAMLTLHVASLCAQSSATPAKQGTTKNQNKGSAAEKAKEADKKAANKITDGVENTKDAAKNVSEKIQKATIRKNTGFMRCYHNFTGYFNVYFNSNDSYKEAVKVIDKRYLYDYSDILPIFPFVSDSIPPLVTTELQRTMEKANKTIKLHSITVKPANKKGKRMNKKEMAFYNKHEYCIWVSDAIFLIGMSNIYLHEYTLARMAFQHIATEYPEDPTSYQARIWAAILEGATDNVASEDNLLLPMMTDRNFPKEHLILRNEAVADLMIRKKEYPKAIRYLEQALDKRWKPSVVQRYHYILGQLYQRQNNYPKAAKHYKRVMRSFAPEKMRVNATINYAYMADGSSSDMRKTLIGMAKKERYADYYDMIYLALAELENRAKNKVQSIEYYRLALTHNRAGSNMKLRISALHKLAMHFEEHSDFESAQAYYDSTAMVMPITDPDYKTVRNKAQNLNKLAINLRIIRTQDSLQRIAKMSEPERKKYLERSIAQAKADSAKQAASALQIAKTNANSGVSTFGGSGKWYFLNAAIVAKGKEDFRKQWGDRRLADNWRIAASSGGWDEPAEEAAQDTAQNAAASSAIADNTASTTSAEYFLRDVPLTPEQMQASNAAVATAMLEAAKAYRDYILDNKSAIKMLENLLKRYPDNEHKMEAYFYLYALYQQENNKKTSDIYQQKLIAEFPDSELVKFLQNPTYTSETERTKNQADALYDKAYQHYVSHEYYEALQLTQEGLSKYKNLPIGANFALLNAMTKGNSTNIAGHIYNLQTVVSAYPNTDVAKTAQDMIALLRENETKLAQQIETDEKEESMSTVAYTTDEGTALFAIAFDPRAISVHQVRFDIIAFNADINADNLNIEVQPLNTSLSLMTVGTFQRILPAMEYYQSVMAATQLAGYQQNTMMFVITQSNLDLLMQDRLVSNYVEFFKKNLVKH